MYPHDLGIGGSQLNAIEIAAAVRQHGHEAAVFGQPGPLVERIEQLDLEFIAAPDPGRRPSPRVIAALRRELRRGRFDVVHGYEWPPMLEGSLASAGLASCTSIGTVMSMAVAPFVPRTTPLIVGTEQIAEFERSRGRDRVFVLEPPVDLEFNVPPAPSVIDDFRRTHRLASGHLLVVTVTRLARELKLEGVLSLVAMIDKIDQPIQLLIVGDGDGRADVAADAASVNLRLGREAVVMSGALSDPRVAYACADVVVGMGGSALRALAFEKPLVVQGEGGFFEVLTPDTLPMFLWQGWYGHGSAAADGPRRVAELVAGLAADATRRAELGRFGRRVVEERFSLTAAARRQSLIYERVAAERAPAADRLTGAARSAAGLARYKAGRFAARFRRKRAVDDFNSRPVARTGGPHGTRRTDAIVFLPGVRWTDVAGTDKQLATALSEFLDVVWVDPPSSFVSRRRRSVEGRERERSGAHSVAASITRVVVNGIPGLTRPGIRTVNNWIVGARARRAVEELGCRARAVVVSSPVTTFPNRLCGERVLYVTDDWVSGAGMLGLAPGRVEALLRRNAERAALVVAVSGDLGHRVEAILGWTGGVGVLANGCNPEQYAAVEPSAGAAGRAGLVGQLNERLDLAALRSVVEAGIELLVVGPRTDRDGPFAAGLEKLLAHPLVDWVGPQPASALPEYFARFAVGLTPYVDNDFNRASFPLKTLEYLAAGLAVVSTDLPAARWLGTDLVTLASSSTDFGRLVRRAVGIATTPELRARRRELAREHSWAVRAEELLARLDTRADWILDRPDLRRPTRVAVAGTDDRPLRTPQE